MGDPPVTDLGQVDIQAHPPGETFTGHFQIAFQGNDVHLLPQPLFGQLNLYDPTLQFSFDTDHSWQAQIGWTLFKHQWTIVGQHLDFSLQQSIARQYGDSAKETMWVANLLQGHIQTQPDRAGVYVFMEGAFTGQRTDAHVWSAGFEGNIGLGWQFDIHVPRILGGH